jgi:hypothetical protein
MMATPVYVELGAKRVVACALDWPGWCRVGKSEEQALEALAAYRPRYAVVAELAGLSLPPDGDPFAVTQRLPTRGGAADFGVPGAVAAGDVRPIDAAEAGRLAALVRAAWTAFDEVVGRAPEELRKGPRGGGRDRTKMVDHVLGGETMYARKIGVKFPQPAIDDAAAIAAARAEVVAVLERPSDGGPPVPNGWPQRYAARRIAWHVLDHAWEMEDRGTPEA